MTGAPPGSELGLVRVVDEARARGAMLGLAIGDALGAIIEFKPPGSFEPVTGYRASETWDIPAGAYTDDTSQALCLAQSLLECGFDTDDQLRRYVDWWTRGYMSSTGECFDIGSGTRHALTRWIEDPQWQPDERYLRAGGAGAISRLAPLVIWAAGREELPEFAHRSADTTHGAPEARSATVDFALLLEHALSEPADTEPQALKQRLLDPKLMPLLSDGYLDRVAADFHDNGYILSCLESALWALATTEDFESGMLAAVNLGRDADTRAAVYGQLAGAIYGVESIPPEWRAGLIDADLIEDTAVQLLVGEGVG